MSEDVILAHAELPSVCEHIHLPLQSGSSRILKAMRRTYDRGRYMDRVALIREHVPDCALTTDIIVGFPGETEADFEETLRGGRGGRLRRRLHLHLLAPPRHRGGDHDRGLHPARRRRRADGAPRRGHPAPRPRARPAVRRPHARRPRRGHLATRRRAVSAAAPATTRSSTSTASRHRGRSCPSRSPARRARRSPARCRSWPAPADFVPSPAYANICSCAGNHNQSKPPTIRACRASPRTSSSAGSTPRRPSTPASTRSGPSPRSTACPTISRVPFEWTVNPYRGCSHACAYCA